MHHLPLNLEGVALERRMDRWENRSQPKTFGDRLPANPVRSYFARVDQLYFGSKWKLLIRGYLLAFGNPSVESSTVEVDPLFSNPATKDFTVQPGSPALDAGYAAILPRWCRQ